MDLFLTVFVGIILLAVNYVVMFAVIRGAVQSALINDRRFQRRVERAVAAEREGSPE